MTSEAYFAYLAAVVVILAIPGPTILLVISCSLTQGRRAALPLVLGVGLGDLTAMTASFVGLGALMAASAALFTVFKFAGAVYLVFLGITTWRRRPETNAPAVDAQCMRRRGNLFRAFAVTACNPKSIAFFCAFLPQFINHHTRVLPQILILGGTFWILAMLAATLYASLAAHLRRIFSAPGALKTIHRLGGSTLIAAGILTASLRRA